LVVDEHAAVRHALATFLSAVDSLVLAGQVANGKDAIRLCASTRPDIVLLDVTLPDMTGAAATSAILKRWPSCRVIGTCTFQEEALIPGVLCAGAAGYLLKNVSADELTAAIHAAYAARQPGTRPV
jgi:DNA-binding NarL/FixJ family response regulator